MTNDVECTHEADCPAHPGVSVKHNLDHPSPYPHDAVHHVDCLDKHQHDPSKTQCRLDARQFQGTYIPWLSKSDAPPKLLMPPASPKLPQTQALIGDYADQHAERELLDKAIIGMGALVDLTARLRLKRIPVTDPETLANEALDMIQVMAAAATQERARIVAYLRKQAELYGADQLDESSAEHTLLDVARVIERGLGSVS